MSTDLEERLRRTTKVGEPPFGSEERMRARLEREGESVPAAPRGRSRRSRIFGAVAVAGMIGGFAGFLFLAAPRGQQTGQAPDVAEPVYSVLSRGKAINLQTPGSPLRVFGFPGVQTGTLRLAGYLPGDLQALVGRGSNDYVCLFLVPRLTSRPTGASGAAKDVRVGTSCAPPADAARTALVVRSWKGPHQALVVADGVGLTIPGFGRVRVRNNLAVLPKRAATATATYEGTARTLRLTRLRPIARGPVGEVLPDPVVPDLTGLASGEFPFVLRAARLDGAVVSAQPVGNIAPGTVIGQSPEPGSRAAGWSAVDVVVAAPTGPEGVREDVSAATFIEWRPPGREFRTRRFIRGTLGDLHGQVTAFVFVRSRAQLRRAQDAGMPFSRPGIRTVVVADRGSRDAARALYRGFGAGYAADADGALARGFRVAKVPSVVVLDRAGRVAYRSSGLPSPRQGKDIEAVLGALQAEPAPADALPDLPRGVWLFEDLPRQPLDAVPAFLRQMGYCDIVPERVWKFGPTRQGTSVWVALARPAYKGAPAGTVFAATPGDRPFPGSLQCGASITARYMMGRPAVRLYAAGRGPRSKTIYLVRNLYDRAEVGSRDVAIENGVLEIEGELPRSFDLVGPLGRRTVIVEPSPLP
jgi:PASTA domain